MRNQPETTHEFNIPRLNWIFAALSLAFLASILWMIYDDWWIKKPWKNYQLTFQKLEAEKLAKDSLNAESRAKQLGLDDINARLKAMSLKENEVADALKTFDAKRVAYDVADRAFKFEKSTLDNKKYLYNNAYEIVKHEHPDWSADKIRETPSVRIAARELDSYERSVHSLELDAQNTEMEKKRAEKKYKDLIADRDELLKNRAVLLAEKEIIEKRIGQLNDKLFTYAFNAPLIDFLSPTLTFNQKVIDTYRKIGRAHV